LAEHEFEIVDATGTPPESWARVEEPRRPPFRVGLVQQAWNPDADAHLGSLAEGIRTAAARGARIVCLQELTLSPYFAVTEDRVEEASSFAEDVETGATTTFAREMASETGALTTGASASTRPYASPRTVT